MTKTNKLKPGILILILVFLLFLIYFFSNNPVFFELKKKIVSSFDVFFDSKEANTYNSVTLVEYSTNLNRKFDKEKYSYNGGMTSQKINLWRLDDDKYKTQKNINEFKLSQYRNEFTTFLAFSLIYLFYKLKKVRKRG